MPYLDTRDLEKRREELQEEYDKLKEDILDAVDEESKEAAEDALEEFEDSEEGDELRELTALSEEISEWSDGNTLIPESEFVEYCQELLSDIGDLPRDIPWYIVIDWEATADNLKADYIEVEYQGITYLVRFA